jgi:hypothetical protein
MEGCRLGWWLTLRHTLLSLAAVLPVFCVHTRAKPPRPDAPAYMHERGICMRWCGRQQCVLVCLLPAVLPAGVLCSVAVCLAQHSHGVQPDYIRNGWGGLPVRSVGVRAQKG